MILRGIGLSLIDIALSCRLKLRGKPRMSALLFIRII